MATLALALGLAACSSPSSTTLTPPSFSSPTTAAGTPSVGVVTGIAEPCEGPVADRTVHVKVRLYSGSALVSTETVRAGAEYRFSVSPGPYLVTGWWGSKPVVVRAGRVVTFDVVDNCS